MKYPMRLKTEQPLFEYMVRLNNSLDYYLFDSFDEALKKSMEVSFGSQIGLMYEIHFNTTTREFFGKNTFTVYDGKVHYDKHKNAELHIQFYVNAGEWLNPNEEWLNILKVNT